MFLFIHNAENSGQLSGITFDCLGNIFFWITTIFTSAVCLIPFFIARRIEYHFSENIINNLMQKKYQHDYAKKIYGKKLEQMTKCTRSIAKFKRMYKANNNEIEVDNYRDKKMKEIVDMYKTNKKSQMKISTHPDQYKQSTLKKKRSYSFTGDMDTKRMMRQFQKNKEVEHKSNNEVNNSNVSEKKDIGKFVKYSVKSSKFL